MLDLILKMNALNILQSSFWSGKGIFVALNSEVNSLNSKIFKFFDANSFLNSKDLVKRFNGNVNIIFKSKRFSRNLIDDFEIKTQLNYGRLNISNFFFISESKISCISNLNLLEKFPVIYFSCSINSPDKKKLLKKIEVSYKGKDEKLYLKTKGKLNILSNKINFEKIEINNHKANKEDLKYYKNSFENILFNESFSNIFELYKIKKFIEEIS